MKSTSETSNDLDISSQQVHDVYRYVSSTRGLSGIIKNKKSMKSSKGKFFSFILSNHTRKDFAMCYLLSRQFYLSQWDVNVEMDYCICIVSRLPFLNMYFRLLENFDKAGGFNITGKFFNVLYVNTIM